MAVVSLALAGLFNATYLLISYLQPTLSMVCPVTGDGCDAARTSIWSTFPPGNGIPVALIGIIGYGLIFGLALAALQTDRLGRLPLPPVLLLLGTIGFGFSAYLMSVQIFVLQAVCFWCALSAVLMTAIFGLTLFDWRTWRSEPAGSAEQPFGPAARRAH